MQAPWVMRHTTNTGTCVVDFGLAGESGLIPQLLCTTTAPLRAYISICTVEEAAAPAESESSNIDIWYR